MKHSFTLILVLFFLSKIFLDQYFTNLGLFRANSSCDNCEYCEENLCFVCQEGYCLTDQGTCVRNKSDFLIS